MAITPKAVLSRRRIAVRFGESPQMAEIEDPNNDVVQVRTKTSVPTFGANA
jgi:hypothetical protein